MTLFDTLNIIYLFLLALAFWSLAFYCALIGYRALTIRKPFLMPNHIWAFFLCNIPNAIFNITSSLSQTPFRHNWFILTISFLNTFFFGSLLFLSWRRPMNYYVFGVRSMESLQEAVTAALQKLKIPNEEKLPQFQLVELKGNLLMIKNGLFVSRLSLPNVPQAVLAEIVAEINRHFQATAVEINVTSGWVYLLVSAFFVLIPFYGFYHRLTS